MGVRNILLCFVFLILSIALRTTHAANICFDCQRIDNPSECKAFKTCADGEYCFHEVTETDDGSPKYSWGCASKQLCKLERNLSNRRKRLDVQKCFECCDSNFCNYGDCKKDFCGSVTCQNNATCTNTPLHHLCNCTTGYTGLFCEIEINECMSSPCQNGAICIDYVGYYSCLCLPGYTGANCEIDINECESSPCANGASCLDQINGFSCDCVPGFTSTLCEVDIDECMSTPCQYNGTCTDRVNGYVCGCIPGITGTNCETDINECANVTCYNGGVCQDHIDNFDCRCEFGFTGLFCETSLGRVCYSCEDGIDDPLNCTNEVICGKDEECYIEHELVSVGVANFNMGCMASGLCSYLQSHDEARARRAKPIQLCYECCDQNGCNHHACSETRNQQNGLWQ